MSFERFDKDFTSGISTPIDAMYKEIAQKKERILIHIITKYLCLNADEETFKRVTCIMFQARPNFEMYYLDYNTSAQACFLEWEIQFPEWDSINGFRRPVIIATSPFDIQHLL